MQYQFLNIFLNQKELLAQSKTAIDPLLLENNSAQVEKIYNFYKSNVNLLYVNGFLGTGKSKIVDYSLAFLSKETIVLKYNCFNSTVLDDILLSFFNEFKNLAMQNIISEPKVKTENFTQKINSYFTQIEKPFVIILNSFEAVLEENRQEIIDFISHLNSINKIKTIVIARTFESKYFSSIPVERITLLGLEKGIVEKYLRAEKIKFSNSNLDELYKHSRGYYYFILFSIKLMKTQNMSLEAFLDNLRNSFMTFFDFLAKQLTKIIPPTTNTLFWFLCLLRHPISIDLLEKLSLYDQEKIDFLLDYGIVAKNNGEIYVQDYFRDKVDADIPHNMAQKIHQYIIDLYETQLPLKPSERNIQISRQTMRKEIEYHLLFLPKKPKKIEKSDLSINYLSYFKGLTSKLKEETLEPKKEKAPQVEKVDLTQRKNVSLNIETLAAMNKPQEQVQQQQKPKLDESILTLQDFIGLIKQAESNYQYAAVIELCERALAFKDDENYQNSLSFIYVKMAHAYQKNADSENAVKYYSFAQEQYEKKGNHAEAIYVKLSIAKIYYDTYKMEKSKEILLDIISNGENFPLLKIKAYLQLADLEENLSNPDAAFNCYKNSISICDKVHDVKTLSELYFKYALSLDDKNDVRNAIEFYNKCINISGDPNVNKFLSAAYSNIATLYFEKNDTANALNNYLKAYEIDKINNNYDGMYYSASKSASIMQKQNNNKALVYFETALDCAKLTKDVFYIVSAALAVGDYHYDIKQNEMALKYYVSALEMAENNFSQDNISKINVRINDIKFRLGVERFENLVDIIKKQLQDEG